MSKKISVGVGLAIINRNNNEAFMGYRIKDDLNRWCFPGGHVEYNENFEQACVRELFEETGLSFNKNLLNYVGTFLIKRDDKIDITIGFSVYVEEFIEYINNSIVNKENHVFKYWKWVNIDDVLNEDKLFLQSENILKKLKQLPLQKNCFFYS